MYKYNNNKEIKYVRKICSHLSEKEISEAESRLRSYVRLAMQVQRRNITEAKGGVRTVEVVREVQLST